MSASPQRFPVCCALLFCFVLKPFAGDVEIDSARSGRPLFPVILNKKYGYMDEKGNLKIPPQFDFGKHFNEQVAAVATSNKWGYVDTSGKLRIDCKFEAADDFQEG